MLILLFLGFLPFDFVLYLQSSIEFDNRHIIALNFEPLVMNSQLGVFVFVDCFYETFAVIVLDNCRHLFVSIKLRHY